MNQKLKVIVAHPGQQHSYHLASAVKKTGQLEKYITTYYSYNSVNIKQLLINSLSKRASKRRCESLNDADVRTFCSFEFLIVSIALRIDKKGKIYRYLNNKLSDHFGKKVARYAIKNHVDVVVMYDTTAEVCFSILKDKAPDILRVMDVSAINRVYMKSIYEDDIQRSPQFSDVLLAERGFIFNSNNQERWKKEIELTEKFIVPSRIVQKSIEYSGKENTSMSICPYGCEFKVHNNQRKEDSDKPIEVLYVGNVTQMKGIFYLLEAMNELPENKVHLTVVGKYDSTSKMFMNYYDKITFAGYVMHDEVKKYLEKSDIFVFPSLGDSFGLAVLEAMSYGLPVICSDLAGAADTIQDGINGFVIPAGSKQAIIEKILYFLNNRDMINTIGQNAIETVKTYSWENYDECIRVFFENIPIK